MADLTERVARAKCWSFQSCRDPKCQAKGGCASPISDGELREARAAIAEVFDALAEPSEAAQNLGAQANCPTETLTSAGTYAVDVWKIMLAQAREEMLP